MTNAGQVADTLAFVERLDVLVNNAGTNVTEPFLEVSEENLDKTLILNVKGYFLVAQAAARRMAEEGSIANVTSQMGHAGV